MASSVTPNQTLIDPLFTIPVGAEDVFVHSSDSSTADVSDFSPTDDTVDISQNSAVIVDQVDVTNDIADEPGIQLDVPTNFTVLSQTLRRAPGGQQVIDVIIQTEDIPGATTYEFQVVKV